MILDSLPIARVERQNLKLRHMHEGMRFYLARLAIAAIVLISCSCRRPLPAADAFDHLRAMDNEFISLFNAIRQTKSFGILQEIQTVENIPLPFYAHTSENAGDVKTFNFERHRGSYFYDTLINRFVLTHQSDSIILHYPIRLNNSKLAKLVISDFGEEKGSGNIMIPTLFKGFLSVDGRKVAEIEHRATLQHHLPVAVDLYAKVESYEFRIILTSRLRRKLSNAVLNVRVDRDGENKINGIIQSKLGFDSNGVMRFHTLRASLSAFPVLLLARVNNDAIDPHTTDFRSEFNDHSRIEAFRLNDNRKLGEIRLKQRARSDKLDYAFYNADGSYVFLEDELFMVREIMNIKK